MTERLQSGLEAVEQTSELIAKELRMMAAGQGEKYRRFTYISPWIKNIWAAAADIIEDRGRKNIHSMVALIAAIVLLGGGSAYAEDLAIGCMPKTQLQTALKENKLSGVDQYLRETPEGEIKTTIVSERDGVGFVDRGRGYIIESRGDNACIVAKMRLDYGPKENQFTLSMMRSLGTLEMTVAEWQHVAKHAKENEADIKKRMMNGTLGQKKPKEKAVIPPGSAETDFLYEFSSEKVTPIKRGVF